MKYFYDWEFLDDGKTIDPISLGMVCEDGRELYLINGEFDLDRYQESPWLRQNVVPYLPITHDWRWDKGTPLYRDRVRTKEQMAAKVIEFIKDDPAVELWGYYAAYDHVCLAQLFGPMMKLPAGIPMYTNDIMQLKDIVGVSRPCHDLVPANPSVHHALADARWTMQVHGAISQEFYRWYPNEVTI